jgi:thiol-disulfide isomerase/thioredoxin
MKLFCLTGFILFNISSLAQTDTLQPKLPPFLKLPEVPSYKILLMDSATFAYKYQLKKKKPVVVIYFNPDCDHCKIETKSIADSMKLLKSVQFVFTSYAKFEEMKKFHEDYGLSRFKNIIYGRDVMFFFPRFYDVKYTPFVAVYGKDWKLLRVFEGGASVAKLLTVLKDE